MLHKTCCSGSRFALPSVAPTLGSTSAPSFYLLHRFMPSSSSLGSWKHRTPSSNGVWHDLSTRGVAQNNLSRVWIFVSCLVGIWILIFYQTELAAPNNGERAGQIGDAMPLRGQPIAHRETERSEQYLRSRRWVRPVNQHESEGENEEHRDQWQGTGGRGGGRAERNNDCETVVDEEGMVVVFSGQLLTAGKATSAVVSDGGYEHYVVCISQHRHHHRVDLELKVESGEADLYVSASEAQPQVERGSTWISASRGDDHLSLPTYAEDFLDKKPSALFVGVHGRPRGAFTLTVTISDISEKEVKARAPLARRRS